jgi:uncharacterized protein (TIGR04255 family)
VKTELDLLNLSDAPRVVLNNAPLVLALCQVRFSSMLSVTDPASLAAFQRDLQSKYPVAAPVQEVELLVGVGPNDLGLRGEQRRLPQWQFTDQDDNWKIVLSQDFLSLETRNYVHFDDFLERLQEALDALSRHIQPTIGTRLGLRYINEIRSGDLHNLDWSDVIRPELLGPLTDKGLVGNTSQVVAMQQLLLRYPNDLGINIHHGLVPSGTTVRLRPKEESPKQAFYLLDFDIFREFSLPQALEMDSKAICQYVAMYHKMIYRLFRWSVTEKYISTIEE